jgi:hypothetical protein
MQTALACSVVPNTFSLYLTDKSKYLPFVVPGGEG